MLFPGTAGQAEITARSLRDTALSAVLRVQVAAVNRIKGMSLAPDRALLYVGGETLRLDARATPAEAQADLAYLSRDTSIARGSATGVITAVAPGAVEVMAYPKGDVSLALPCQVTVKRDVPVLEIGGDRTARPGDTLLFPVKATQEYGVIAALKWDLDGDGILGRFRTAETAMPRRAFDGKDTLLAAIFQVRDGEGNVTQAFVFVRVGSATRLSPPAFTAGTTPSPTSDPRPTWKWASAAGGTGRYRIALDGGPERETRDTAFTADSLRDGSHSLSLRELDAFGSSSPTVVRVIEVVRRRPAPIVTVLPVAAGVAWAWSPAPGSPGDRRLSLPPFRAGGLVARNGRYRLCPRGSGDGDLFPRGGRTGCGRELVFAGIADPNQVLTGLPSQPVYDWCLLVPRPEVRYFRPTSWETPMGERTDPCT